MKFEHWESSALNFSVMLGQEKSQLLYRGDQLCFLEEAYRQTGMITWQSFPIRTKAVCRTLLFSVLCMHMVCVSAGLHMPVCEATDSFVDSVSGLWSPGRLASHPGLLRSLPLMAFPLLLSLHLYKLLGKKLFVCFFFWQE